MAGTVRSLSAPARLTQTVLTRNRILVVEDEPAWRLALEKRLRLDLFQTRGAARQVCALELMSAWHPDLVVLDLALDGPLAGIDLLRAKRRDPEAAAIPVLVITASRDQETLDTVYKEGASACLAKPYQPERLSALARNLTRRRSTSW
jgi:DNA-binding response OmpR family regulator